MELIRKLGHLPTVNEVLLAKRSDPSMPSYTVFSRRFGKTQPLLAAKVLEWCARHDGVDDVAEILARRVRTPAPAPREREPIEVVGSVYLFKSGRYYKIGHTNSEGRRERELAILMPEKGETVHAINTDDPAGIEAYWHRRFDSKRKGGEWFDLDAADVRAFKRRRFM